MVFFLAVFTDFFLNYFIVLPVSRIGFSVRFGVYIFLPQCTVVTWRQLPASASDMMNVRDKFTLCSSVVVECGLKRQNICKNRLYEYDADKTWADVLQELLKESNMSNSDNDFEPHKTDILSVTVSDKL